MPSNAALDIPEAIAARSPSPVSARGALGASAPWRETVVDGVRLAYDDEGEGPAIVCLHAIGHGASDYARLRERLRGRHRVLVLDWPGHGNSGADRVPTGATRYAQILAGFLTAVGAEHPVIIGNSIGGTAAIRLAAEQPSRVRALVLANPGRLDPTDALTPVFCGLMARFFAAGASGAWWYPRAFRRYYKMVLPAPPAAAQRERIVAAARDMAPVLAEAWRSFGEPAAEVASVVPRVGCPVLLTWAKRDRINQLSRARRTIAQFPRAQLELFAGGHSAFLETPDEFEASLDRFLRSIQA